MNLAKTFRAIALACALASAGYVSAAPILLVDSSGILTGAKNLDVGGTLYDVTFADGSCDELFNGCDSTSFTFSTDAATRVASQALRDHVFVDGALGQFDSNPGTVSGCTNTTLCYIIIPYKVELDSGWRMFTAGGVYNTTDLDGPSFTSGPTSFDFRVLDFNTFARFELSSPVADVPEPASIALFGLAMAGLALNRRRKV